MLVSASEFYSDAIFFILTSFLQNDDDECMRVTINLDDDALARLDQFAQERPMSRGRAASELIRRGFSRPAPTHVVNGLRVFSGSQGKSRISAELVRKLDSEQDLDKVR